VAGRDLGPVDFANDPLRLSYQVAAQLRVINPERQKLLEADTAALRLRGGITLLRREVTLVSRTRTVPVSPRNLQVEPTFN
jgi:hypothetical protein